MKRHRLVDRARTAIVPDILASSLILCVLRPADLPWIGTAVIVATAMTALALFCVRATWLAARHARLSRDLDRIGSPTDICGFDARLIPGTGGPFVAGLRQPKVYCPERSVSSLTAAELRAVMAHEAWHQRSHAPCRLLLLAAASWLVGAMPAARRRLDIARARLEIDADRHAIRSGNDPSHLASALLRLAPSPRSDGMASFDEASELRLRALLGESEPSPDTGSVELAWAAVIVATLACLTLATL